MGQGTSAPESITPQGPSVSGDLKTPLVHSVTNISSNDEENQVVVVGTVVEDDDDKFVNQSIIDEGRELALLLKAEYEGTSAQFLKKRIQIFLKSEYILKFVGLLATSLASLFTTSSCDIEICYSFILAAVALTILSAVVPYIPYWEDEPTQEIFFAYKPAIETTLDRTFMVGPKKTKFAKFPKIYVGDCVCDEMKYSLPGQEGELSEFDLAMKFKAFLEELQEKDVKHGEGWSAYICFCLDYCFRNGGVSYNGKIPNPKSITQKEFQNRLDNAHAEHEKKVKEADEVFAREKESVTLKQKKEKDRYIDCCRVYEEDLNTFYNRQHAVQRIINVLLFLLWAAGFLYLAVCDDSKPYCNQVAAPAFVFEISIEFYIRRYHIDWDVKVDEGVESYWKSRTEGSLFTPDDEQVSHRHQNQNNANSYCKSFLRFLCCKQRRR